MLKVDKKVVMAGLSLLCGVGSMVVNLVSKNEETNEAAEKAAKIVMDNLSKKEN